MRSEKLSLHFALCILHFALLSVPVHASDFRDIHIHGFVSQGWLKTDSNNYLSDTQDGTFQFNEIGINFGSVLSEQLRLGIQLFSRDIGDYYNNDIVLDWAVADYRFSNTWGIKAGKVKMPFGLYNQIRDTDMLRTPILMPSGIYSETRRDYTDAYNGVGVYGSLDVFGAADMNTELFFGTSEISSDGIFFKSDFEKIAKTSSRTLSQYLSYENPNMDTKHVGGGSVSWNTPTDGLKIAFSIMTLGTDISCDLKSSTGITAARFESDNDISSIQVWSMEYSVKGLSVATEWMMMRVRNDVRIHDLSQEGNIITFSNVQRSQSWYLQASYQVNDWLTYGLYYSEYYPNREDKLGKNLVLKGEPDYFAWQKELVPTIRIDIGKNWLIKLEAHFTDGAALVNEFENPDGTERHWTLWAVKTSFNF
ncbi:MAG: hypothetical protein HC887_08880 [Desulfobacteraceae bacterium]|nr:hypothetical protein [Desulfobacteraceae bacterium]